MGENVFGERITKLREDRKLTTQKVADELGISRVSITHYEKGQRKPDIEILTKLSRYFGVSSDYLLGLSVSPTNNKSLGFVCNYLNLPDQVIEKIKANSDDTLTQILDSNEFWEVKRWLNIAIRYQAYLKPNADLAAISSMDSAGLYSENGKGCGHEVWDCTPTYPVLGVCPSGWHLPSEAEVNTLKSYLSSQSGYLCSSSTNNIAKSLASKAGWTEDATACAVGNNQSTNNATGFNAYPAGVYSSSSYQSYGQSTHFILDESGKHLSLAYGQPSCFSWASNGDASVRCIKGATPPSVATSATVTDKTGNSATVGGSIYTDGINFDFNASSVTQMGICYGTSTSPTISDSKKTVTVAQGAFTVALTGLSQTTTYYYRAFATNANGTSYGEVKSFTTQTGAKVNTNSTTSIGKTTATLRGYIYPNDATVTGWGFYLYKQNADGTYPTSATADLWTESTATGKTQSGITYNFTTAPQSGMYYFYITNGLDSGTTYKVVAEIEYTLGSFSDWVTTSTKSDGTPYEPTFTTLSNPSVTTVSYTYPGTGTTFTLKGNITNAGNPQYTEKGFFVSSGSNPSSTSYNRQVTASGSGTGEYTGTISRTTPNSTWYYRAYAKCSDGSYVYGTVKSFTTPNKPEIHFTGYYETPYNYSSNVTNTSIKMKSAYGSTGGSNLTERGFIFCRVQHLPPILIVLYVFPCWSVKMEPHVS